jgi:hypothetical protein
MMLVRIRVNKHCEVEVVFLVVQSKSGGGLIVRLGAKAVGLDVAGFRSGLNIFVNERRFSWRGGRLVLEILLIHPPRLLHVV